MLDKGASISIINRTAFPLNIALISPFSYALPLSHSNGLDSGENWTTRVPFRSHVLLRRTALHIRYDNEDNRFRGSLKDELVATGILLAQLLAGLAGFLWIFFAMARYLRTMIYGGSISTRRIRGEFFVVIVFGCLLYYLTQSSKCCIIARGCRIYSLLLIKDAIIFIRRRKDIS